MMKMCNIPARLCFVALVLSLAGCKTKRLVQGSRSMEPTIRSGEKITVDLQAYTDSDPSRWDVVIFESPIGAPSLWCYRIVGLPGETIHIRDGVLSVDGQAMPRPSWLKLAPYELVDQSIPTAAPGPISLPFKVPSDCYFVLGDNVSNALDSRYWGALEKSKILGKVPGK